MKKGFTLVEVLIVVVIIAILASLIVPRMLAQTDKAKAAEALQVVGVIKRAAERYYDSHGTFVIPSNDSKIYSNPVGMGTNSGDWGELGLSDFGHPSKWAYSYRGYATSFYTSASSAYMVDQIQYDGTSPTSGYWECAGGLFKYADGDATGAKGCTV